jgi:hypothetical protein
MWLWESELYERGFRRRSDRYWQCERGYGLPPAAHLSVFSWGEQTIPGRRRRERRLLVELTEFHVTFLLGGEHVHFYYHEVLHNDWQPLGHTSANEFRRLGHEPLAWLVHADTIAAKMTAALGGTFYPRDGPLAVQSGG